MPPAGCTRSAARTPRPARPRPALPPPPRGHEHAKRSLAEHRPGAGELISRCQPTQNTQADACPGDCPLLMTIVEGFTPSAVAPGCFCAGGFVEMWAAHPGPRDREHQTDRLLSRTEHCFVRALKGSDNARKGSETALKGGCFSHRPLQERVAVWGSRRGVCDRSSGRRTRRQRSEQSRQYTGGAAKGSGRQRKAATGTLSVGRRNSQTACRAAGDPNGVAA